MNVLAQFIGRIRTVWADQVCGQYQHEEPSSSWPADQAATRVTLDLITGRLRIQKNPGQTLADTRPIHHQWTRPG